MAAKRVGITIQEVNHANRDAHGLTSAAVVDFVARNKCRQHFSSVSELLDVHDRYISEIGESIAGESRWVTHGQYQRREPPCETPGRVLAVIEDIDFSATRGLDKATFLSMVESRWVEHHHNVIVLGPTGVGKTFIACALAQRAIRDGHRAIYVRVPRLLDDLALARADVLLLDDFLIRSLSDDQAADLLEVVEDRATKSTIITSQLPVSHWHEGLGDPTVDAILDRLLEHAHRVTLTGDSRRRTKTTTQEPIE